MRGGRWGGSHRVGVVGAADLGEVGVPYSVDQVERELSHQQAVHPTEGELYEGETLLRQVRVQRRVDARDDLLLGACSVLEGV